MLYPLLCAVVLLCYACCCVRPSFPRKCQLKCQIPLEATSSTSTPVQSHPRARVFLAASGGPWKSEMASRCQIGPSSLASSLYRTRQPRLVNALLDPDRVNMASRPSDGRGERGWGGGEEDPHIHNHGGSGHLAEEATWAVAPSK